MRHFFFFFFSYGWIFRLVVSLPSLRCYDSIVNEGCFVWTKALRDSRNPFPNDFHFSPPTPLPTVNSKWMKNFSLPSTPPQIPRNDISSRRNEVVKRGGPSPFGRDAAAVSKTGLRRMARARGRFDRFVFYDYVGINEGVTVLHLTSE